jgi:hypothetical protein
MGFVLPITDLQNGIDDSNIIPEFQFLLEAKPRILGKPIQAVAYTKFLRAITRLNVGIGNYAHVRFFTIPPDINALLNREYNKIKQEHYLKHNCFSPTDFRQATLAYAFNMPIISQDTHILITIQNHFQYNALWPSDINRNAIPPQVILVDTNILLGSLQKDNPQRVEINKMFQNPQYIFLIPEDVIDEFQILSADPIKAKRRNNPRKNFMFAH